MVGRVIETSFIGAAFVILSLVDNKTKFVRDAAVTFRRGESQRIIQFYIDYSVFGNNLLALSKSKISMC